MQRFRMQVTYRLVMRVVCPSNTSKKKKKKKNDWLLSAWFYLRYQNDTRGQQAWFVTRKFEKRCPSTFTVHFLCPRRRIYHPISILCTRSRRTQERTNSLAFSTTTPYNSIQRLYGFARNLTFLYRVAHSDRHYTHALLNSLRLMHVRS